MSQIELHKLLLPGQVVDLKSSSKREALLELANTLKDNPNIRDHAAFVDAIFKREELVSTGVGLGFAIPHVKIPEVRDYVVAVGRRKEGLEFDALDGQPVRLIFMIGASENLTRDFVKMLARVMKLLKSGETRLALIEAALPDAFIEIIRRDDMRAAG